ncbi:MAG: S16 family serine protease, partial [Myxococcota bacterium]
YLFSSPGRLIRSIIRAGVMNPLLLLDEIDKLGQRWSDPAAALLEVLDPECNKQFTDSYLQFPFDLSEVFVICTANVAANIDPILRDRLEIVEMTGYTRDEKLELASTHVVPHAVVEAGLDRTAVQFDSEAIEELIDHYTQEAGVRELSRSIATVCRGVALDTVTSGPSAQPRVIRRQDIRLHLGKPRAYIDRAAETLPPGVATGLTWTQVGGGLMPIECARLPHGDGTLHFTGKIGDILEESARLAISHVRSRTDTFAVSAQFLDHSDLHFHFPDGATPKQGPSAGLAIALALVSLLRDQPTRADTGMTGEITLTGQLRPVGGIKAKLLGAAAGGLKRVILPAANRTDVECDLPDITGDLELIYVSTIAEAIPAALIAPDTPEE